MHTQLGIEIAAPAQRIFELAADVETWSRMLPHYRRSQVTGTFAGRTLAAFVALRPLLGPIGLPVAWRAVCWSEDSDPADLQLHFSHVRGITSGMRVTWHIRPLIGTADVGNTGASGLTTAVTIEHDFSRPLPLVGTQLIPRVVDRFFTRSIAMRTLARFRELAERDEPIAPENRDSES